MRNGGIKLFEALSHAETNHIIRLLEKGIEIERMERELLRPDDKETSDCIYDGELLLIFLYLRKLGC